MGQPDGERGSAGRPGGRLDGAPVRGHQLADDCQTDARARDFPMAPSPPQAVEDVWERAYRRAEGCFPNGVIAASKYWPPVSRIDNVYGDRHLVCSCPPIEDYTQAAE